jgi:hypothetical protein
LNLSRLVSFIKTVPWACKLIATAAPLEAFFVTMLVFIQGAAPALSILVLGRTVSWLVNVRNSVGEEAPIFLAALWALLFCLECFLSPFVSVIRMRLNLDFAQFLANLAEIGCTQLYEFLRKGGKNPSFKIHYAGFCLSLADLPKIEQSREHRNRGLYFQLVFIITALNKSRHVVFAKSLTSSELVTTERRDWHFF